MSSASAASPSEELKPKLDPSSIPHARRLLILSLRYAISQKEYASLERRILSRVPASVSLNAPSKDEFETVCSSPGRDDYIPAATRAGLRIFLASNIALKSWDAISARLARRKNKNIRVVARVPLFKDPNFLFSVSISTLVVLHRLLYRFFYTLRENLSLPHAKTFRQRHPKVSKLFLSPLSPSIGSSLAGLALAIHPASERRVAIAVYALTRALEFSYNRLEDEGWFRNRPWWFGSWLLFPLTCGQLLYAFVFDRDCIPAEYGSFIMGYSGEYVQARPEGYPPYLDWPGPYEIIDSIKKIAEMKYPPFSSPILYPNVNTIPASLESLAPLLEPAHPAIKSLQCAMLHPNEPSCGKTYLHFWGNEFTRIAKFITVVYALAWIPRYKSFIKNPLDSLGKLSKGALLTSTSTTGSIGTAWAATCFFQKTLPRTFLPKARFWLGGFLGGLWAIVDSKGGKGNFMYIFRIGIISAWKVLVKKGLVIPMKNGDVYLFILSLATINALFDKKPTSVSGGGVRMVLQSLRGKGLKDPVAEQKKFADATNAAAAATIEEETKVENEKKEVVRGEDDKTK